jgi:hypothetical protein
MFILLCRERTSPARLEVRPAPLCKWLVSLFSIIGDCENSADAIFDKPGVGRIGQQKRVYRYLSGETSYKPTSRPRSCEFGLDLSSGLPVIQTQSDKNFYKQAQIVVVGSLREKHQGLSI